MLLQEIQDSLSYMKGHVTSMDEVIETKKAEVPALEQKARLEHALLAARARHAAHWRA
jgi:hypothetical protein